MSAEPAVAAKIKTWVLEKAERDGLVAPRVDISLLGPEAAHPVCSNPLLDPLEARNYQRLRFVVSCPGAGEVRATVLARARVTAEVVTAATDVATAQVLRDSDVTVERQEIPAAGVPLTNPADAVGKAVRRPVKAGQPLHSRMLVEPVIVRKGDHVRIVARLGDIEVSAAGEVLEPGAQDATIRVRNATSGKEIRARVLGPSTVEPAEIAGKRGE